MRLRVSLLWFLGAVAAASGGFVALLLVAWLVADKVPVR